MPAVQMLILATYFFEQTALIVRKNGCTGMSVDGVSLRPAKP